MIWLESAFMGKTRIHLIISGTVQGVSFRSSTLKEAIRLDLTGWVKNCADGSVETSAEGEQDQVEEFILWCRHGPSLAKVESVKIRKEKFIGEFKNFSVKH